MGAREALRAAGIEPLRLAPKEGLALLNGTQGDRVSAAPPSCAPKNALLASQLPAR